MIDRDTLVAGLKAHQFPTVDRFGFKQEVIIETMDGPVGRITGFEHDVTAGTRKLDTDVPFVEQMIKEIKDDLEGLAGQDIKYGISIFVTLEPCFVRYAKAVNIDIQNSSKMEELYRGEK